ncbi:2-succinyl-5-enolpyruvyl-6-hydroxy-3-cyclohexene-1-carboxylic-acid synthase [Cellulomonas dongxiuzhuiae]|uniref:2-succinyl-5-enolpyruvyl-6-hydroxy-3-cyclohexene-1-carboxylate synthase n=1 Tax=Cellulomonas dongxiuzhuiae TaxID=2819979 RepID=A0ABX8GJ82_9CELL|nr:2-succinyl-5-enolpyruvyl-6-hydroxy-3-cyclohexene-1-carboxylic-acid synthase [Cellulomonas dongxiuzhuiae]QWC15319.1 2-succinyl-5-enolpyruvyl-6-hydroxy-3-cyclohexene-1-carboxylic-acid synthase [Cellulomonas dongxiuzhuiae]
MMAGVTPPPEDPPVRRRRRTPAGPARAAGPPPSPAVAAARVLVQALAALGVRDVVLAPGSRSAPLAYALADAALPDDERPAGAPALRLHVRIDERDAGFLALGLAKASVHAGERGPSPARPVAVVTTSGTAVANLHPAVLEAHHAGLPLVLLTADRPHELRGTGANQTTEQPQMFASAVRLVVDVPAPGGLPGEDRDLRRTVSRALAAATGARTGDPGPVHLNLAFRDPLVPGAEPWPVPAEAGLSQVTTRAQPAEHVAAATGALPLVVDLVDDAGDDRARAPRRARGAVPTVVVAGDGAGPGAARLAEANGWPLLAEPSSGARQGPNAVGAYRLLLADERLGGRVGRVVVLGRPTLTRPVQALLGRPDVDVLVVAPRGADWPDAVRNASQVLLEVPSRMRQGKVGAPAGWLDAWRTADAATQDVLDGVLDTPEDARRSRSGPRVSGWALARAVARASAPDDVLVVGASNPVRDLDLVARWDLAPLVLANRGLAGIDGTIATATGVALALPTRRVRAYLGDVTFLHDVGGLLRGPAEPSVNLQIVVANDDGGSVFATLEHGAPERAEVFERVFATPHGVDVAALCAAYGVRHTRVVDTDGLLPALAAPGTGTSVVEVRVDRAHRRSLVERLEVEVAAAVDKALSPLS